jgi:hypothetical protein
MTPGTPEQLLILNTAALRRAAPDAWREFSAALQNYAGQQLHEMAVAPTDKLQVAQGRAQMLISLLKTFEQSLVMAEKILDNRKQ